MLRISNAKHSVLLTDDIEEQVERYLIETESNLDADILIAAHHGSKTSSYRPFRLIMWFFQVVI